MQFEPIAIVGQSCILPGALDPDELWNAVVQNRDLVSPVSEDYWRLDKRAILTDPDGQTQDHAWSDSGGYVRGFADRFDPGGFTLPAKEIETLDPLFHWVLHGVREALKSATMQTPRPAETPPVGLVLGNLAYPTFGLVEYAESTWFGSEKNDGAGRLTVPEALNSDPRNRFSSGLPAHLASQALNLGGEAFSLDSACASSLYAIKLACDRLQDRRYDVMVAGAVNRTDDLFIHIGFCALKAMSRTGQSRPFSADADGLVPAEGAAFVVLKRLSDAVANGDKILGVIRGVGLSNDGTAGGFLSPARAGQVKAMQAAYEMSGLKPSDISLLECHATGTPVGDSTEISSSAEIFAGVTDLPIGSLKSNLGHLITVAGVAGLLKVLGAMRTGTRPPSRPVEHPLDAINGTSLRILQAPEPWDVEPSTPRRAAVSAFGFGGNNAHLIVEEWKPESVAQHDVRPSEAPQRSAIAIVDLEITAGPFENAQQFRQALLSGEQGSRVETVGVALSGLRFPPNDLKHTLPQQLLVLEVARRLAARNTQIPAEATSVFVGMGCDPEIARYSSRWRLDGWAERWEDEGKPVTDEWVQAAKAALIPGLEAAGVVGTMPNIPANRINAQLNYLGPSFTIAAEELSGIRALECAVDALQKGEIDAAMVGAVDLSDEVVHQAAAARLLDIYRQEPGDAAVVLLLKRVEDAQRDGDTILAIIDEHLLEEAPAHDPNPLHLGLATGVPALTAQFGHAHAASGLLHVAAAALCLHDRVTPGIDADGKPRAAHPWLSTTLRTASVPVDALGDQASEVRLRQGPSSTAASTAGDEKPVIPFAQRAQSAMSEAKRNLDVANERFLAPLEMTEFYIFSGESAEDLLSVLAQNRQSSSGPARLVITARGQDELAQRIVAARTALERRIAGGATDTSGPQMLDKGATWSSAPVEGEVGFVFVGAAAAYQGMGRELLLALPALGERVVEKFPVLAESQHWLAVDSGQNVLDPFKILQGCSMLSQVHGIVTQEWLGIKPDALLGVSSGETNFVFASGAWHDMDEMFGEMDTSGMYTREIAGEYDTARRAWQDKGVETIDWTGWRVLAPVDEVKAALAGEEFAYLTMINAPTDCLIAGQADACARVVEKLGKHRCVRNENEIIAHHPVMKSWEGPWYDIHSRPVDPVPDVRFYSNASGTHYSPTRELVAAALTDQATSGVDFRRVVNAAYDDGVRIFIEHGPRNVCSGWIRSILGEREHLVVALDRPQNGLDQLLDSVAQLIAAGVDLDTTLLLDALAASTADHEITPNSGPTLPFPAHYPPVALPPLPVSGVAQADSAAGHRSGQPQITNQTRDRMVTDYQFMEPAPPLPPVLAYYAQDYTNGAQNGIANGRSAGSVSNPPVDDRSAPAATRPPAPSPTPSKQTQSKQTPPPVLPPTTSRQAPPPSVPAAQPPASTPPVPAAQPPASTPPVPAAPQAPIMARSEPQATPPAEINPIRAQMVEQLTAFNAQVSAAHQKFLAMQQQAMSRLLNLYESVAPGSEAGGAPDAGVGQALAQPTAPPLPAPPEPPAQSAVEAPQIENPTLERPVASTPTVQEPAPPPVATPKPVAKPKPMPMPEAKPEPVKVRKIEPPLTISGTAENLPGPKLNREQLEYMASGKISDVLGPIFAQQDDYFRQVRMPMPPLLLADRVTGIEGEAGAVGTKGTIWTETDITEDSWYLQNGRIPAGIMVESGQADLLLISYLGADFLNKSERVYRLLGCEATFHGELGKVGDTLCFKIQIDGYAQQGEVRLFFFSYDCSIDGEVVFSVRSGQAGFFTDEELDHSGGVIWDPEDAEIIEDVRLDPPAVTGLPSAYSAEQVTALSEGRVVDCFGDQFWPTQTHVRTPTISSRRMLLFDEVVDFDPSGGPWKRGYLRAVDHLADDEWFFDGHFHNDPCMPGTLMLEGCLQTMSFYLAGLGYTLDRDGWRFEPVPEETYKLICRGQVTPGARDVVYELFIEEVIDGPIPTLYADLLCTVDGLAAFYCRRMGLQLVPDYPLAARPSLLEGNELADPDPARNARTPDHVYDPRSIAACAWGKPSDAFGSMFERFDGPERCPRLPGPPYLFMTRITKIDAPKGQPVVGGHLEAEYQIPSDAWYFAENSNATMPYAVLLEAALQPCGWFASYKGSVLQSDIELFFRNLDGTATQFREVFPEDGILRTRVENTSLSRLGTMTIVGFEVACFVDAIDESGTPVEERVFEMSTSFGFFPKEALADQAGLPVTETDRERLAEPSDFRRELGPRPPRYCNSQPALPGPMLLLLDRVSGYWPEGGEAGLGRVRAEIDVTPDEWFFKCHFMGDPVQPGSLGIEAMIQTLQFYMLERELGDGIERPRFEAIQFDEAMTWKYRGQVLPSADRVTVELEVTDVTVEPGRMAQATANVSYWCDGLRIYEATALGMRIVSNEASAEDPLRTIGEERLDPEVDLWLKDHCPTWTVPALAMMSMVDRLADGALRRAPGRRVTGLRNVRVHRWLGFADGAQSVKTAGAPVRADHVAMQLQVWEEERRRFSVVASGDVLIAETYPLPGRPWTPLVDAEIMPDPYASGELFHGPAYQMLTELRMNEVGATYWLDLDANGVPESVLNQGLLDAATHGIPHDALWRWSSKIPADVAAYPVAIPQATFHRATPTSGRIRCEARFAGFRDDDPQFPVIHIQIIEENEVGADDVWAEIVLVEALFPKGPIGSVDADKRRAFLHEQTYVAGVGLSEWDGGQNSVSLADVKASDWLAGTIAAAYGVDDPDVASDVERLARDVGIREHAARTLQAHPASLHLTEVEAAEDGSQTATVQVSSAKMPLNHVDVSVLRSEDGWIASDAPSDTTSKNLDLQCVLDFWHNRLKTGPSLVEDLTLALMQRFVRSVQIEDPEALAALQGQGVLYLANHQLDLESTLFVSLMAGLRDNLTGAVARLELNESWVGPFWEQCFEHPHVDNPDILLLIDRSSPEAVLTSLEGAIERIRSDQTSLLIHVEGAHALRAGQPVEVVSTSLIDLAVARGIAIVPVRFAGGLPVESVDEPLAFPVDYGKQDVWIGAPILAETLAVMPSAERKTAVLAAINGFGGRWLEERPNPGDEVFGAAVTEWQETHDVSATQATLFRALEGATNPSVETLRLLAAVSGESTDGLPALDEDVEHWLLAFAREAFGLTLVSV